MSTLFSYFKPTQEKKDKTKDAKNITPSSKTKHNVTSELSRSALSPLATTNQTPSRHQRGDSPGEDSEDEIGTTGKNKAGRFKRKSAMTAAEKERGAKRKRKRVFESDEDESDEEFQAPPTPNESDNDYSVAMETGDDSVAMETTPLRKPITNKHSSVKKTPKLSASFASTSTPRSKIATPKSSVSTPKSTFTTPVHNTSIATPSSANTSISTVPSLYMHQKLDWLKEENVKDKSGHRPNHEEYNPRTLLVPLSFLNKCTPAMKQWWTVKTDNYDTILFFKVGKFYELYHMDAEVGVKELGLVFMKGDTAHCGFPEVAFGRYSHTLVRRGYKVARVEQTETPQMLDQRNKNSSRYGTKSDKVVKRELCSLITKGTRTIGFFQEAEPEGDEAYLLAIKEKTHSQAEHEFGVCFVDTCIGTFHLGQFNDDRQCSRLRTLLAHYPPAQVLVSRKNLSVKCSQILNQTLPQSIHDTLAPESEFWEASRTLKVLKEENLFGEQGEVTTNNNAILSCGDYFPSVLQQMTSEGDSLGLTPNESQELAISCLGACVWTLKRCQIEKQLLNMRQFKEYVPIDNEGAGSQQGDITICNPNLKRHHMVLDDITLQNLDIIDNNGVTMGTLLHVIDHCKTAFGKRLLKRWVCSPPCDCATITLRQDAVSDLLNNHTLFDDLRDTLKTLPDMERLLRRVFVMGYKHKGDAHPECRAIMYEETLYSKKKIGDFLSLLAGFEASSKLIDAFATHYDSCNSKILRRLLTLATKGGKFPDMLMLIDFFKEAFDHEKARKEGVIVPGEGVNEDYDKATSGITRVREQLQEYLQKQRKRLGCKSIVYWGTGVKNRYQLEVPDSIVAPAEYDLKSQRKGFRRYRTQWVESILESLVQHEEQRDVALKDTMRTVFHRFGDKFAMWEVAVECLAILDVLVSMATYSTGSGGDMCRPVLVDTPTPFLDIRGGRHPCVVKTFSGGDFIPNDVLINTDRVPDGESCVVVTGPNMGGKSTLMRQTGLIAILAQLGCYVPAESCSLSPIDRVFTRLGASDRIIQGESTFFVELSETATILQHATPHSLVLLDELGRGTATHDGRAIAGAVITKIAGDIGCRTLFSTHYHALVEELSHDRHVTLGHMSCMVEDEDTDEVGVANDEVGGAKESVTFLYKFVEGACPKSYGFNVARLAGLPNEIIRVARNKSMMLESRMKQLKTFRLLMRDDLNMETFREIVGEL